MSNCTWLVLLALVAHTAECDRHELELPLAKHAVERVLHIGLEPPLQANTTHLA
jgi:hypothetical protein